MKNRSRCPPGFTLIELMVVLAVVAILALLAVPSLQDKYIRDEITAAMPLAQLAEAPVAQAWNATHALPADNVQAGLPAAEKIVNNYVAATRIQNGAVHVTFGNRAHAILRGHTLSFRPAVVLDAPIVPVTWVCGYSAPPHNMTLFGANETDIPARFLPPLCRPVTN